LQTLRQGELQAVRTNMSVVDSLRPVQFLKTRSRRGRQRGQSLVEFAIFVPILAIILLTAADLGRVYLGWVTLNNVARIGASYAAQNPGAWSGGGNATLQAKYRSLMAKDANGIDCTLPATLPNPTFADSSHAVGSRVTVDLNCEFQLITPLMSNLIGDANGRLDVSASAAFAVRFGSFDSDVVFNGGNWSTPTPSPTATPTPTPTATPTPTPTPTPPPGATPGPATPTPTAAPTQTPVTISFYGTPTSIDAYGGGPPGSVDENQVVGIPNLAVTFTNSTVGNQGSCQWDFGDGATSNSCGNTVAHTYTTRGTYNVTLTVNGQSLTRSSYVWVTCKVPAFSGVRKNSASSTWTSAGFTAGNLTTLPGNGNYKISYQSLAGGLVGPPGGCDAQIQVGP
jgi:Flp pilus assembly protein TadG